MFGALKRGRFRSMASLILVVNVVGELQQKRTLAASCGFLAAARLSCITKLSKLALLLMLTWRPLSGLFIEQMESTRLDFSSLKY